MPDVYARAYLDSGTQKLVPTGPGRAVRFIAGGATITDERDIAHLLLLPSLTVEIEPEWVDLVPKWKAQCQERPILARLVVPGGLIEFSAIALPTDSEPRVKHRTSEQVKRSKRATSNYKRAGTRGRQVAVSPERRERLKQRMIELNKTRESRKVLIADARLE